MIRILILRLFMIYSTGFALEARSEALVLEPQFEPARGFFPESFKVIITSPSPEFNIRFRRDGGDPNASDPCVEAPLLIERTGVIRAALFLGGVKIGPVISQTYILGTNHEIDVVSLSTVPEDLHDEEKGILIHPLERGREWERPTGIEFLSRVNSSFGLSAGLRIHGSSSRGLDKKSFRIHFRREYGEGKLRRPVFGKFSPPPEFDSLVLRGGSGDSSLASCFVEQCGERKNACATYLKDRISHQLFSNLGGSAVHSKPVALYINGEYQGLYDLLEHVDQTFCESRFGEGDWLVSSLTGNADFSPKWKEYIDLLRSSSREQRASLLEELDRESLEAILILKIFSSDFDYAPNIKITKQISPPGLWRFVAWDSDLGFDCQAIDIVDHMLLQRDDLAVIFQALLDVPEANRNFGSKLFEAVHGALSPERFERIVRDLAEEISSEIARESIRWGGGGVEAWEENVQRLVNFALNRQSELQEKANFAIKPLQLPPEFSPKALTGEPLIGIVFRAEDPALGERELASRLEKRGGKVRLLKVSNIRPVIDLHGLDLAILLPGIGSEVLVDSDNLSRVPVIFMNGSLLEDVFPLSSSRAFGLAQSSRPAETPSELVAALPRWHLEHLQEARLLDLPLPPFGEGVEVSLQVGGPIQSSLALLLAADINSYFVNGREILSRRVYFPLDALGSLSGYGWRTLDEAIDWSLQENRKTGRFVRGDVNVDGLVKVDDALLLLRYLFRGGVGLQCLDAADVSDDGRLGIHDVLILLLGVFQNFPQVQPYPHSGWDTTPDSLTCNVGSVLKSGFETGGQHGHE